MSGSSYVVLNIFTNDGVIQHFIQNRNLDLLIKESVSKAKEICSKGYYHVDGHNKYNYKKNEINKITWEIV